MFENNLLAFLFQNAEINPCSYPYASALWSWYRPKHLGVQAITRPLICIQKRNLKGEAYLSVSS